MAKLLKTTQPYWLGNRLIPADTVFPEGHPDAIEQYVVEFEVPDPPAPKGKAAKPKE